MGTADMKMDMQRMQEMLDMMRQLGERLQTYARETRDPYAWCTYMSMTNDVESHQKSMQQMMQAMKEEQNAGMTQQMGDMHMRMAPAMMGMMREKMRM